MRTVNYSDILQGSLALAGIPLVGFDPTQPEFALMRTFHDRRLRVAWEAHCWPDICRVEQRSFFPPWNATTTYPAGSMVLDLPTLNYLQALQASTGQPPTINGVTNDVYWAPLQPQYQADPWILGYAYAIEAQVLNLADQNFYQCYAAGVLVTGGPGRNTVTYQLNPVTGEYVGGSDTISFGGHFTPVTYMILPPGDPLIPTTGHPSPPVGTYVLAAVTVTAPTAIVVYATSPTLINPLWTDFGTETGGISTAVSAPGSMPGTDGWGLLTPFLRTIFYQQYDTNGNALTPLGEVFAAYDRDPRITTKKSKLPFTLTSDGLNFIQSGSAICYTPQASICAYVWLYYRLQRPLLTGSLFDPTLIYVPGQQVYFVNPVTAMGDFYNQSGTGPTTAGQSPTTTPASWSVIQLPYIFREHMAQGGYADWLTGDGQTDKSQAIESVAQQLLEMEADKLQRQQQQANRFDWRG